MVKNGTLLVFTLTISLVLAELFVRSFVPVREVGLALSLHDPSVGKRLKPNLNTVRHAPEFSMTFSTNSQGFRGPELTGAPKPLLFLGDSFTMGYGVSDGAEFPSIVGARIREVLPDHRVDIINAGIGNNGNGQWVRFLRLHLREFDPAVVFLQVMANDFEDNLRERSFLLSEHGQLIENELTVPWDRRIEEYLSRIPGVTHSYFYAALRESVGARRQSRPVHHAVVSGSPPGDSNNVPYAYQLTEKLILEAVRLCRDSNYPVVAILVGLADARLDLVANALRGQGVPMVLVPTKEERPDLYFEIDGHWNEMGHELAADLILTVLPPGLAALWERSDLL